MNRYGSIYIVTNAVTGEQYVGQTRQKGRVRGMYTLEKVV
jgi:hypothetical protein